MLNVDSAVAGHELDLDGVPSLRDLVLDAAGGDHRRPLGQDAPPGSGSRSSARPGPARRRSISPDPLWDGNGDQPRLGRGPARRAVRPADELARLGLGLHGRSSTTWACRPSTSGSAGGTGSITRSTTTSPGWRSSATPSSSPTPRRPGSTRVIAMRAAAADVVPLRFVPYGEALREHVDDLRRMIERKARRGRARPVATAVHELRGPRRPGQGGPRLSRPRPPRSTARPTTLARQRRRAARRSWRGSTTP